MLTLREDPSANEAAAEGLRRALWWASDRLRAADGSESADGSDGREGRRALPLVPERHFQQMVR